jgi:hypothetical protein
MAHDCRLGEIFGGHDEEGVHALTVLLGVPIKAFKVTEDPNLLLDVELATQVCEKMGAWKQLQQLDEVQEYLTIGEFLERFSVFSHRREFMAAYLAVKKKQIP